MNKQSVLIFKLPELFKILNELKDHLDFDIYNFSKKEESSLFHSPDVAILGIWFCSFNGGNTFLTIITSHTI